MFLNPWLDLYAPYLALAGGGVAVAALVWCFVLWKRLRLTEQRYQELTTGAEGSNLEAILQSHLANVRLAGERADNAYNAVERLEQEGRSHLQHVALVRYNPFSHTGGDQSFVLALADGEGNGALINSLHARDGTRIYAKPLAAWESRHALTDEETDAITRARNNIRG